MKQFSPCWILDGLEPQSGSITIQYGMVTYVPVTSCTVGGRYTSPERVSGCYFRLREQHRLTF